MSQKNMAEIRLASAVTRSAGDMKRYDNSEATLAREMEVQLSCHAANGFTPVPRPRWPRYGRAFRFGGRLRSFGSDNTRM